MTTFEFFLEHLASLGLNYDTGFLIPASEQKLDAPIGYRFESGHQQIDLYVREEFWNASKSHVKLGESQVIESPAGEFRLTRIIK
jgi:hypothetical protein